MERILAKQGLCYIYGWVNTIALKSFIHVFHDFPVSHLKKVKHYKATQILNKQKHALR